MNKLGVVCFFMMLPVMIKVSDNYDSKKNNDFDLVIQDEYKNITNQINSESDNNNQLFDVASDMIGDFHYICREYALNRQKNLEKYAKEKVDFIDKFKKYCKKFEYLQDYNKTNHCEKDCKLALNSVEKNREEKQKDLLYCDECKERPFSDYL